ncbi:succinyl-diaminopimelate desuccinylase [Helicobacter burdigaliensis]|uniref:succinyl-diaminopimelate desuccinylase n=1 Tax=Helicobacter burdigaliensis TaxID=2315334 RepID=UPI000EF6649D|nr:succinyl-diaminopimelate desuccinylase [Helicobacter burdigaliensis]
MNEIEILKKLISYPTITPQECGIYEFVKEILPSFKVKEFHKNGIKNLFLYKEFKESKSNHHLCFAGHIDVVPAGEGWESDPFIPLVKEGYIYGRGTQDMKGGVAAFLSAVCELEKKGDFKILSILLTSDEEGEAIYGTKYVLEELKKQDFLPHFAIVAEPTSLKEFGDMIKIGRRGSINGVLKILGKQGHVAYPSKCINPLDFLAQVLPKISGFNLDEGSCGFEPSKIVITDIRGGMEVVNVTPNEVKIMFNIRNSPSTTLEDVKRHFATILKDIPHKLELKQSSKPFLTNKESKIALKMQEALKQINGFLPALSTGGGTSDARYFAEFGVEVIECGVVNDKIHSLNECVKMSEITALKQCFKELLEKF